MCRLQTVGNFSGIVCCTYINISIMHITIMQLFDQWLKERDNNTWCTVAQHYVTHQGEWKLDLFATSVLAPKHSEKSVLKSWEWLASQEFGNSMMDGNVKDGSLMMYEETSKSIGREKVVIEPFTFGRQWGDTWPLRFELIQNFILFYNLYLDKDCYKAVSTSGEITDVVRIGTEHEKTFIKIRTNFLRNYLAFKDRILVRQFDNRIGREGKTPPLSVRDDCKERLNNDDYVFLKMTYDDDSGGMLLGRDIILPLAERRDLLGWPKGKCDFIVGINDAGKNILATYNKDDGPAKFLIPVYFERAVLQKYYNNPTRYDVTDNMVSCDSHWGIPIDTNNAGLVQVYLGDIVEHLPYNEQLHWKSYNVQPEGGITEKRYNRDFEGKFVESDDIVYQFKKSMKIFQEVFEARFNFKLFKTLNDADKFKETSIRIPLNNEPNEFENQISYLSTLLQESIDQTSIKKNLRGTTNKGSINELEMFLNEQGLSTDIIIPLRTIQDLRSKSVAHRKRSDYTNTIKKYGIDESNRVEFFRKLLVDITKAFHEFPLHNSALQPKQ